MAAKVSKAQKIRALYAEGKTCNEIAQIVGCLPEYARVCAQQRGKGHWYSKADATYELRRNGGKTFKEARRIGRKKRYQTDAVYRKRHIDKCAEYRARKCAERQVVHQ